MGLMGQAMNTATAAAGRNSKALRIYAIAMGLLTNPIKTTRKGLASLPGIFGKVGKSAQSGAKATSSTGTVLAKQEVRLLSLVLYSVNLLVSLNS